MDTPKVYYKSGYKYQLTRDYRNFVGICPPEDIVTDYITLTKDGVLKIIRSYAWNGANGPTIDTKDTIRGSLEHDALYQLMEMGLLSQAFREAADGRLHTCMNEDGANPLRADAWFEAVRLFGAPNATPGSGEKELVAP